MTPPEDPQAGTATGGDAPPAVSVCLTTLTKRADFLRAAKGLRAPAPSMTLQARRRDPGEASGIRIGYTCSKKVGNAVARNRARRRLREAARAVLPGGGQDGWDYVLIGRPDITAARPFEDLKSDLAQALSRVHRGR